MLMDPDTNINEQRVIVRRLLYVETTRAELEHDAQRLALLADWLDHWLSSGGHLPKDWTTLGGTR